MLKTLPRGAGMDIDLFFREVKSELNNPDQVPWTEGSLTKIFHLFPGKSDWGDRLKQATGGTPFINSLKMEFLAVPGVEGVWMGKTETRVRDFRAYAKAVRHDASGGAHVLGFNEKGEPVWTPNPNATWENPGFPQDDDHPVVCVSWEEARGMADWLSREEPGLTYRLPTDAEWSAAAGDLETYPWGNTWPPPPGSGNYFGVEGPRNWPGRGWRTIPAFDDGAERTRRVASDRANPFGFFDLGGNVWEWCEDTYRASMNDPEVRRAIPAAAHDTGPAGTGYRVLRGGAWDDWHEITLRSRYRNWGAPGERFDKDGFRLVVTLSRDG
jgi:sulfatase modifying factor 1